MKFRFLDILAWIFLIITVVLLFWYMFGNSPAGVAIYSGIAGFVLVKMWNFNERLIGVEMGSKNGFSLIRKDMDLLKGDTGLLKNDMISIKDDLSFIRGGLKK